LTTASIILPVLSVVGTLSGTLIGTWLGSRLTRSTAERQWRRDRCLEAYTDVLRGWSLFNMEAHRLYLTYLTPSYDPDVHYQFLHEKLALDHAIFRSILLSSYEMNDICIQLSECVGTITVQANASPKLPHDDWTKLTTGEANAIAAKFMAAAQNDLRIDDPPSLSISNWWKTLVASFK
jgi:hypothetical protein